jgi:peptidoglycan/LPS O-acetylase OafA/YrhL
MTKYIKGFDGLRCYSIILVIVTHLGVAHYFAEGSYLKDNVFYFFSGGAGVNIFFAISGFLITTLILNEVKETGKLNIKFFFIRRFLRLLPPIIPFFIAIFIFMKQGYIRDTTIGLLASMFYLFNFVPKAKAFWSAELSHTWSLAVEEQFYVIWALVFNFFNSRKIRIIIFILLVLSIIAAYILPFIVITLGGKDYLIDQVFFPYRWTIPAIGPILIGALFALLNFSNWNNIQNKFKQKSSLFLSLSIFISPFYLPDILLPIINLFHGLGVVLILLWISNNQSSSIIKVLEWKPIKYIGTISYGIYIWQGFFVRTGPSMTPKIWVHDFPQNVVFTFLIAVISYELFEKKMLKLKKKFR